MNEKLFSPIILFLLLLLAMGCGPEAQTGAVFSKYSAHACASPSPADTLPPPDNEEVEVSDRLGNKEVPDSGVPISPDFEAELNFLLGKFKPEQHPDFVVIKQPYANRSGMYLQQETYEAFKKMWQAARRDGITLTIISATRNFDYQKGIWERKWNNLLTQIKDPRERALKILEYSAMPGSSRHHWGSDIDLNDLNNASFNAGGSHARMYEWMQKHAAEYGFCQPYTAKDEYRPNGYNEEKWHWSYSPVADPLLHTYEVHIRDNMISGFKGAETAPSIGVVKNYVLGVACK